MLQMQTGKTVPGYVLQMALWSVCKCVCVCVNVCVFLMSRMTLCMEPLPLLYEYACVDVNMQREALWMINRPEKHHINTFIHSVHFLLIFMSLYSVTSLLFWLFIRAFITEEVFLHSSTEGGDVCTVPFDLRFKWFNTDLNYYIKLFTASYKLTDNRNKWKMIKNFTLFVAQQTKLIWVTWPSISMFPLS